MAPIKLLVGIPTLNRADQLKNTLHSILRNTVLPQKIIIVDQSENEKTKHIVNYFREKLNIEYLNVNYKGLTKARNEILSYAKDFDVVTFLDDDVELDKNYFEEIVKAFQEDKNLAGCQGFIENQGGIKGFLFRLAEGMPLTGSPKVTNCFVNTYPFFPPSRPVISEWLSGCNMSYRVDYIEKEKFNENFILYGLGEDLEFSYRLFVSGKRLLMLPSARLKHIPSGLKRLPSRVAVMMRLAYRRYMIAKYRSQVDMLFQEYVEWYRRTFRIHRIVRPQLWKSMMKTIEEVLNELKSHFDMIDKGDLNSVNSLILKEVSM